MGRVGLVLEIRWLIVRVFWKGGGIVVEVRELEFRGLMGVNGG